MCVGAEIVHTNWIGHVDSAFVELHRWCTYQRILNSDELNCCNVTVTLHISHAVNAPYCGDSLHFCEGVEIAAVLDHQCLCELCCGVSRRQHPNPSILCPPFQHFSDRSVNKRHSTDINKCCIRLIKNSCIRLCRGAQVGLGPPSGRYHI